MSSCRVIVPKIGINAGKEVKSVLYANLISELGDTRKATKVYQVAYTSAFMKSFGNWVTDPDSVKDRLDTNGEPQVQHLKEYVSKATFNLRTDKPLESIRKAFGLDQIMTRGQAQLLVDHLNKLYPNINAYWDARNGEKAVVNIDFKDRQYSPDISKAMFSKNLLSRMLDKFPKLRVQFITKDDIQHILRDDKLIRQLGGIDVITSFNKGGVVYLVDGKITDEVVIEEFLHPFVQAISEKNGQAVLDLFEEAKKTYPDLWTSIEREYSSDRGFTKTDRVKELVTQALAKATKNEYESNTTEISKQDFMEKFTEFWSRVIDILKSLFNNKVNADLIKPGTTIADIAKLMNVKDLQFDTSASVLDIWFNLTTEEAKPEVEFDIPGDMFDKIFAKVENFYGKIRSRHDFFEKMQTNRKGKFSPSKTTIDRLELLIAEFGNDLEQAKLGNSKGAIIQSFSKMLDEISQETERISKYVNDKKNVLTDPYISVVLEGVNVVESYKSIGLSVKMGITNPALEAKIVEAEAKLDALKDDLMDSVEDYLTETIKSNTGNKNLTEEDIRKMLEESYDISSADYFLGDMSTSTDTLLAVIDKVFKDAKQEVFDRHDSFRDKLQSLGNKIATLSPSKKNMYDFMLVFNKAGEFTGRYVQKIGYQFWEKYYNVRNKIYNPDGTKKVYKIISSVNGASKEDLEYNIQLQKDKEEYRKFNQPEQVEAGTFRDGDYKRYTQEYKDARDEYMFFDGYGWNVKPEYEGTVKYQQFLNKYYGEEVESYVAVKDKDSDGNWRHKGRVALQTMRFVKSQYVEIRDKSAFGEDLRESKWVKLMNPQTELEKAQSEFYKFFIESFEGQDGALGKLPQEIMRDMTGKVPRVRMSFFNKIKEKKENFIKVLGKSIRLFRTPDEYSTQRLTDETGMISDGLPIFYTGDIQSKKRLDSLKAKLKQIKADFVSKKITHKEFVDQRKMYRQLLNSEYGKVSNDEISRDMVESLLVFSQMAENYEVMGNIEDTVRAAHHVLENRNVYVKDKRGNLLTKLGTKDPVLDKGINSLAYKRFSKWMRMTFYNNDEVDNSTAGIVAKRLQNLTSVQGIGLNIFGAVNNYVMGRINNAIETYGGVFYDTKAGFRATTIFNKEYMPNLVNEIKYAKTSSEHYKEHRSASKYSALVKHFRMIRKMQSGEGRPQDSSMVDWMFVFQEGGEYNVQSKTGVAILMTEKLKNTVTGEELTIYDAFDFDKNTGKLTLKPGFEFDAKAKHAVTNKIYEANKQIHGNYAPEDRMVIQQHWLGSLATQFHKWVYPLFKARFKKRYFDENLGQLEGRYVTIARLFEYAHSLGWNFKNAYMSLDNLQKKNMRRNIAEFGFFMASAGLFFVFKALAEGVPDDDENLKRWLNFLRYQQDRQMMEIRTMMPVIGIDQQWQVAKSPLATLKTIKEFKDAIVSTLSVPFDAANEELRFERGVNEGELKWWKEWKDVIPGFKAANRWDSFSTVTEFYIQ